MALGVDRKDLVMVGVLLSGTLLAVLNLTLLSPALPAIMGSLNVDATTVQWLTSGYSLVEAVVIPLSAYLIGRFTTRQLFISFLCVFMVGSLAAALAPVFPVLLLGRILQAVCTGAIMPMVFTVILLVFPREMRGTAMGVIGLIIGFAPAVGPSLAGLLVDSVGWRWLFGIVFALSVVVIVLAVFTLKDYGDFKRSRFDVPSVVLSTCGLVCLLFGLSTFASTPNMALTAGLIVVGIILMGFYVRRQLTIPEPMLKVGILSTRKYAISVIIIVTVQAALMGTGVITPLYIQGVRGYSATMSGVAMLPGAVIGAFMGLVSGRLFDRFGAKRIVVPGAFVALAGAGCLVALGMDSSFVFIMLAYTVLTVGLQFTMTPLNTWGVNSLDNSVIQHAQGLSNTLNQVAASVGTALLVSISALSPLLVPDASPVEQAFTGYHMAYTATAILMAVAVLIIVLFVSDKDRRAKGASGEAPETLPDYAAVLDGVTVDARADESRIELLGGTMGTKVQDAMNGDPVVATSDMPMRSIIRLMSATDSSGLPIVDADGVLVGFISDGDIANYLGRHDISVIDTTLNLYRFVDDSPLKGRLLGLLDLNVMGIATKKVISVEADLPIDDACRVLAERRIKKVPVVSNGQLVGTLSRRDIMRNLSEIVDAIEEQDKGQSERAC